MKVYFISGLAADKRVFKHIQLPAGFEPVYIDWIDPIKNESLQSYALRLAEKIKTTEKFSLVGLSMGGMIATEIAKKYKPVVTILLSSVPTYKQFPARFRLAYFIRLHKVVPVTFLKSASLVLRLFSSEDIQDRIVLSQVVKDSDTGFIRWAIGAILQWKNEDIPDSLWHIHGTKDRILPMRNAKPTHIIDNGGHLMVMSKARELNELLRRMLSSKTESIE